MANLLGQNIGTNYKGILNLNTLNGNLSGTLQAVTDGDGNASPLTLSTGEVGISRTIALSAGATNVRLINETYTINNSGVQTGTATGIFLNATETGGGLNEMKHNLMDLRVNNSTVFRITSAGLMDAQEIGSFWFNGLFYNTSDDITKFGGSIRLSNVIQFGGGTIAFPAISRQGTTSNIVICLADAAGSAGAGLGVGMAKATALNASAILQADSTTQGFLPPRMTTTQRNAISSPASGLIVYDTDTNKSYTYDGSSWQAHY
jgi:hypothetical protein